MTHPRAADFFKVYEVELSGAAMQVVEIPVRGFVMHLGVKRGQPTLFVMAEYDAVLEPHTFYVVYEGEDAPKPSKGFVMYHIASVELPHSQRFIHVLDYREDRRADIQATFLDQLPASFFETGAGAPAAPPDACVEYEEDPRATGFSGKRQT